MRSPDLSVGEMARYSGLTSKALRHYDRIGLLHPAHVDPDTGYRRYEQAQLEPARLIATLRSVDLPIEDVRACLQAVTDGTAGDATGGADLVLDVLRRHRRRLEARLTRIQTSLHRIDHLTSERNWPTMATTQEQPNQDDERQKAADLFNGVWRLLENEDRTADDDAAMIHMAHASTYHWAQVGKAVNQVRGEWQCSRVYAVVGRPEPAIYHARRALSICQREGIGDFDLAFCYEAMARASAVGGDAEEAKRWIEEALAAAEDISDADDRELILSDLQTVPGSAAP